MIDRNGSIPAMWEICRSSLPPSTATNINVQLLAIEAARTRKKEYIYMAAMMDPHAGAELSMDDIKSMCDDLIEAHGDWMPKFH